MGHFLYLFNVGRVGVTGDGGGRVDAFSKGNLAGLGRRRWRRRKSVEARSPSTSGLWRHQDVREDREGRGFWCGVCAEEMVEEEEEMHNQNALSKQEPNFAGRRAVRTVNRFSPARYSNIFGIILNLCTSHTGGVPIASKGEDSGVICSRTLFRTQIQYPGGWSTFHDGRRVQFACVLTRANDLCFLSGR